MVMYILVCGNRALVKEKENLITPMETLMTVTGMLTRELLVTSLSRMVASTGLSTRTRRSLDLIRESTPMELSLRDLLPMEKSMDPVLTLSSLELCGKETSRMIFYKEMATRSKKVKDSRLSLKTIRSKRP
mgnify:CR=1 FL=1